MEENSQGVAVTVRIPVHSAENSHSSTQQGAGN